MKDTKLEMPTEREIQSGKERPSQPKLKDKSKIELKNTTSEEKRREDKNYKRGSAAN